MVRRLAQALLQRVDGGEIERAAAPLQQGHLIEAVIFEGIDEIWLQWRHLASDAESPVIQMAPGPAGDLADFRRDQIAVHLTVEFADAGERHMVEIEVETHADGVRRHQKVHVPVLVERHLGVAGAGAERAKHHGGAAALPPHQLGDGVNVVERERHDGRAPGQAGDLFVAGVRQVGEAGARDDIGAGKQLANDLAHGPRAKQ